jgi:hypothetical protein
MAINLTGIAGATCGPWIFVVTPQTGFPSLDLEECENTLRFSRDGVGLCDLTIDDGLVVAGTQITATLSQAWSTTLGDGTFTAELISVPEPGVRYVSRGELKLAIEPATDPGDETPDEITVVRVVYAQRHKAVSDDDVPNPPEGEFTDYNSIESGGWVTKDSDGNIEPVGSGGGGGSGASEAYVDAGDAATLAAAATDATTKANAAQAAAIASAATDATTKANAAQAAAISAAATDATTKANAAQAAAATDATTKASAAQAAAIAAAATDATTKADAAQAAAIAARAPGGATGSVQYNNAGAHGGTALSYVTSLGFVGIALAALPTARILFGDDGAIAINSVAPFELIAPEIVTVGNLDQEGPGGVDWQFAGSGVFEFGGAVEWHASGGHFDIYSDAGFRLRVPATMASDVVLPLAAGTSGQFVQGNGSGTWTMATPTLANLAIASAGCSLVGCAASTPGAHADIAIGTNGHVVMRTANAVTSGLVAAANIDATFTTKIGRLNAAGKYVATIEVASLASLTVAAGTDLVSVTHAAATCALNVAALGIGEAYTVQKNNTSSEAITVVGGGSDTVNGGSAGVAMTLPSSTTARSTTTAAPSWLVTRISSTELTVA